MSPLGCNSERRRKKGASRKWLKKKLWKDQQEIGRDIERHIRMTSKRWRKIVKDRPARDW